MEVWRGTQPRMGQEPHALWTARQGVWDTGVAHPAGMQVEGAVKWSAAVGHQRPTLRAANPLVVEGNPQR